MATDTYIVSAKTTVATQIVWAGEGPTLVANTSLTGTFWISESNAANVNDTQGIVPIGPNGSVVVDGTRDFFAITNSVTPVEISCIAGGMSTFLGLTGGSGSLVLPAIFSPNFLHNVSGWSINSNGTAEFNLVTIRNSITIGAAEFYYSGTPAFGNLVASITGPVSGGLDPFGNTYIGGAVTYENSGSTPVAAASQVNNNIAFYAWSGSAWIQEAVFSNGAYISTFAGFNIDVPAGQLIGLNGQLTVPLVAQSNHTFTVTDGLDGVTYDVERNTVVLANTTGSLVALTSILTATSGVSTYRVHGQLYLNIPVANAQFQLNLAGQAGSSGEIGYTVSRAATFYGAVAGGVNIAVGLGVNLPAANGFIVTFDGIIQTPINGTINLQVGSLTAQGIVVASNSFMDVMPVG
jgi:hypothetical protein